MNPSHTNRLRPRDRVPSVSPRASPGSSPTLNRRSGSLPISEGNESRIVEAVEVVEVRRISNEKVAHITNNNLTSGENRVNLQPSNVARSSKNRV